MRTLKSIGPSALDLEIRLLAVSAEEELAAHVSLKDPSCSSNFVDTTRDRLHGFLRLLINRFERNLDVDLACVCLESLLLRHGDLLLVKPSDHVQIRASDNVGDQIHALLSAEHVVNKPPLTVELVSKAIAAKTKAANLLTRRLTRSICLVDFIRNPTTTLHF
ncbi:hypothetical protein EG68_00749 [Paragonimus skrjabini miyazakii]|uniref:Small-subunit processome Utp21 domain-containing protein n=1 Tax=Paragonimus skrjabini miyazakii TaxID=59628 RepID=A0A8S9Z3H7_9TREM|nr:hypothetical protein EG68_00749 [Paragonimus skrjabini miyazakii]